MTKRTDSEVAYETLQRVIRTETRLMTLGTKLGVDLKVEDDIEVVADSCSVYLTSMDVPLSSILKAARRAGLHARDVNVFFNGAIVAEVLA